MASSARGHELDQGHEPHQGTACLDPLVTWETHRRNETIIGKPIGKPGENGGLPSCSKRLRWLWFQSSFYSWETSLSKWPLSIAMLLFTRG